MAKYLKRIGTKAEKYAVEINLEKVEMHLATETRVSVTFKRGDHKIETKNAPNLEDGYAEFDEELILPVTFYHDTKKEKYLEKQGILTVSIITKKGPKIAGQTKFDLAEYLNNDEKEKHEVIPILKCLDKAAKFHFTIKLVPFDELQNDVSGGQCSDESGEEHAKTHRTEDSQEHSSEINTTKGKKVNRSHQESDTKTDKGKKGVSQSPAPKGKTKGLGTKKSDNSDTDSDNDKPAPKKDDRITRKTATKDNPADKKTQSKSPFKGGILGMFGKKKSVDSSDSEANGVNNIVKAVGMNVIKNKAMDLFKGGKNKSSGTSDSEEEKKNKKVEEKTKGGLGMFLKSKAADLFNGKKEDSSASSDNDYEEKMKAKRDEQNKLKDHMSGVEHNLRVNKMEKDGLQKKYDALLAEHEETKEELAELKLQNEQLKKNYERAKTALENKKDAAPSHTMDPEVEFYKDKIEELEHEITQLKKAGTSQTNAKGKEAQGEFAKKYEDLEKKYKNLEQELKKQKEKSEAIEKESVSSLDNADKIPFEKYNKLSKDFMALKEENEILKTKNEELEAAVQEKENQISDLEAKIRSKDEEITDLKLNTSKSSHSADNAAKYLTKIAELERKNRALEEAQNKKGGKQDLDKKGLKDDTASNASKTKQMEEELTKISIENESLKKQLKEANNKLSNFKYDNKQVDELKDRIQVLEKSVKMYEKDLSTAKMNWASDSGQKEKLEQELEELRNENEQLKFQMNKMSENLLNTKTNLGAVMNAIFEHGGPDMFDQIEAAVSFGEHE